MTVTNSSPLTEKSLDTQRALTEHVVSQQVAPRMSAPIPQSVSVRSAAGLPGEFTGHRTQEQTEEQDYRVEGFTTRYARVDDFAPGGDGAARVQRLSSPSHAKYLAPHVKGELTAPGRGGNESAIVNVALLDTGFGKYQSRKSWWNACNGRIPDKCW